MARPDEHVNQTRTHPTLSTKPTSYNKPYSLDYKGYNHCTDDIASPAAEPSRERDRPIIRRPFVIWISNSNSYFVVK